MKITKCLAHIDVPGKVVSHLVGTHHTHVHRMFAGTMFMLFGVGISIITRDAGMFLKILGDIFTPLLHGFGTVPYLNWALTLIHEDSPKEKKIEEPKAQLESEDILY